MASVRIPAKGFPKSMMDGVSPVGVVRSDFSVLEGSGGWWHADRQALEGGPVWSGRLPFGWPSHSILRRGSCPLALNFPEIGCNFFHAWGRRNSLHFSAVFCLCICVSLCVFVWRRRHRQRLRHAEVKASPGAAAVRVLRHPVSGIALPRASYLACSSSNSR